MPWSAEGFRLPCSPPWRAGWHHTPANRPAKTGRISTVTIKSVVRVRNLNVFRKKSRISQEIGPTFRPPPFSGEPKATVSGAGEVSMEPGDLRELLEQVRSGGLTIEAAL